MGTHLYPIPAGTRACGFGTKAEVERLLFSLHWDVKKPRVTGGDSRQIGRVQLGHLGHLEVTGTPAS